MYSTVTTHSIFQIELLANLVNETYPDSLSAYFASLLDFDDTYYCDVFTDIHLSFICIKIEVSLQFDISTDKVDVVYVNLVPAGIVPNFFWWK